MRQGRHHLIADQEQIRAFAWKLAKFNTVCLIAAPVLAGFLKDAQALPIASAMASYETIIQKRACHDGRVSDPIPTESVFSTSQAFAEGTGMFDGHADSQTTIINAVATSTAKAGPITATGNVDAVVTIPVAIPCRDWRMRLFASSSVVSTQSEVFSSGAVTFGRNSLHAVFVIDKLSDLQSVTFEPQSFGLSSIILSGDHGAADADLTFRMLQISMGQVIEEIDLRFSTPEKIGDPLIATSAADPAFADQSAKLFSYNETTDTYFLQNLFLPILIDPISNANAPRAFVFDMSTTLTVPEPNPAVLFSIGLIAIGLASILSRAGEPCWKVKV